LEPVPHYSLFTDPSYTTAFNVSGNPALSVCSGFAANGMPQSLQIVADCSRTRLCCARVTPMKRPRPGVIGGLR